MISVVGIDDNGKKITIASLNDGPPESDTVVAYEKLIRETAAQGGYLLFGDGAPQAISKEQEAANDSAPLELLAALSKTASSKDDPARIEEATNQYKSYVLILGKERIPLTESGCPIVGYDSADGKGRLVLNRSLKGPFLDGTRDETPAEKIVIVDQSAGGKAGFKLMWHKYSPWKRRAKHPIASAFYTVTGAPLWDSDVVYAFEYRDVVYTVPAPAGR